MEQLRRLTRTLLDPQLAASTLRPEVLELVSVFERAQGNGSERQVDITRGETRTAAGLALSPTMAMMCAEDYMRTIVFIRGTHAAILDGRNRIADRPLRILYAGCGPFATLVVPLMSVLSPAEAQFTLLDVHADSIESARTAIENLGLDTSVSGYETTDIADYRVSKEEPPDLILMEIMQACLESEPQVALSRHLLHEAPDAVLIPREIRIDLQLVDAGREFAALAADTDGIACDRDRIALGPVFTLNKENLRDWEQVTSARLPGATIQLPDPLESRYQLMYLTTVNVFDGHELSDYESGLTGPRLVAIDDGIKPGCTIHFHYALGAKPQLRAETRVEPPCGT